MNESVFCVLITITKSGYIRITPMSEKPKFAHYIGRVATRGNTVSIYCTEQLSVLAQMSMVGRVARQLVRDREVGQ